MKRLIPLFLLIVALAPCTLGQVLGKHSFRMDGEISDRIAGNSIVDILIENEVVWVATGNGLNSTTDGGETWTTYDHRHNLGQGGISAIAIHKGVIWVATAYDTTVQDEALPIGGGLSYSTNGGESWTYIPQPGVTPVQGLTYDIALTDSSIWLACYGQSLQYSADNGSTWTTRVPDKRPWDPFQYLNQRVFSVIATDDAIWAGTAGGINRSTDGGETWMNMNHDNAGISGNFVVALGEQVVDGKSIIWAATWKAEGRTEYYGVSRTENNGLTWKICLEGEFVHNFAFDGPAVYAATDNGLMKSTDGGQTWGTYPRMTDKNTGQWIDWRIFYSARVQRDQFDGGPPPILWAGGADGLARTEDNGLTWTIFRALEPTGANETYAYPNPWSPMRYESADIPYPLRLQYRIDESMKVTIKIYDFALDLVRTLEAHHPQAGDNWQEWDGKNDKGDVVANGVYYYIVEKEGGDAAHGKIVILD